MIPLLAQKEDELTPLNPTFLENLNNTKLTCKSCSDEIQVQDSFVVVFEVEGKYDFRLSCKSCIANGNPTYIGSIHEFQKRVKSGQLEEMLNNAKS